MRYRCDYVNIFITALVGVGVRCIVSLSSYSGASKPPMYGDYEAQRHWQEVTVNLPIHHWYKNSSDNDLLYWGLDYPPLTAYHSQVLGVMANYVDSNYVILHKSRGYESNDHKSFMRLTVLVSDIFIYIPASILTVLSMNRIISPKHVSSVLLLLILYPGQILIDNGHFQYNNMSLGLFLLAVACILRNRYNLASLCYSLALNYKQMELYHSLPIFVYLLKISLYQKPFPKNILNLFKIGMIVCLTFLTLWSPWVMSFDKFGTVLRRLFPISRGVFEDKVANVWCSLNTVYKFKKNFNNEQMALLCLVTTLLAILPTNINLFIKCGEKSFLFALMNTSLSFFLYSFQVHEKSILLAAIPASFLFQFMPYTVVCFMKVSILSLFPLLLKDDLHVVYFCSTISYCIILRHLYKVKYGEEKIINTRLSYLMDILDITIIVISVAVMLLKPPGNYPHMWPLLISIFCCTVFIICLLFSTILQYNFQDYVKIKLFKFYKTE